MASAEPAEGPGPGPSTRDYLLVAALALLAFLPILGNGFVWDDVPETFSIEYTQRWENLPHFFTTEVSGYYRPIRSVVYLVGRTLFGPSPVVFHALSLLLNALAALAATRFVWTLSRDRALSLAAGILFAVHPLHTEAVAWVTASSDPLAGPFQFLALALLVEGRRREPTDPARAWRLTLYGGLATLLACFAKESSIILFLLVGAIDLVPLPGSPRPAAWKGRLARIGAALVPALLFFAIRTAVLGVVAPRPDRPGVGLIENLAAFARVAAEYLRLSVLPVGLSAHWEVDFTRGLTHPVTLAALGLALVLLAVAVIYRHRLPYLALGLAWFYLSLIPVSNLVPLNQFASEKYTYFPSFGICLVLGWLAVVLGRRLAARGTGARRVALAAGLLVLVAATGMSLARTRVWKDEVRLWTDVLKKEPDSTRARFQLARALWIEGDQVLRSPSGEAPVTAAERLAAVEQLTRAEALLAEVGEIDPTDAWARIELGRVRMVLAGEARDRGEIEEARRLRRVAGWALEEAVTASPAWERPHYLLGVFLEEEGRHAEARRHLEEARRLDRVRPPGEEGLRSDTYFDPRLTDAELRVLERILTAGSEEASTDVPALPPARSMDEARQVIAAALAAPATADPHHLLATLEQAVEATDRFPEATRPEERAALLIRLGWARGVLGDVGGAALAYRQAVPLMEAEARRHPGSAPVAYYLAEALLSSGRREEARAALERCLSLDPDHPAARRLLDHLAGEPLP